MSTTALYFGSFNPLHKGHLQIARYVLDYLPVDELTFVLSPRNPLKSATVALNSRDRLKTLRQAIEKFSQEYCTSHSCTKKINVSDIEFSLPSPLYTYNTLTALKSMYPDKKFVVVMGADNLAIIESWHKWKEILSEYQVYVYPRSGVDGIGLCEKYGAHYMNGNKVDISSTMIREGLVQNDLEL